MKTLFTNAKILVAAAAMLSAVMVSNSGECRSDSPKYGAPETVSAYAEVYAYGSTDKAKKAGILQSDIGEVRQVILNEFRDCFKEFCLSDESLNKLSDVYLDKIKNSVNISVKSSGGSADNPVVKLEAKILEKDSYENQANNDPNLQGLVFGALGLKNEGKTDDDLKVDPEYQKTAVECITNFINALDFGATKALDVTCTKVKGSDGKTYWAPQGTATLYQFIRDEHTSKS